MESGPSRVNAPLEEPVIPRSRRDLFKDHENDEHGHRRHQRQAPEVIDPAKHAVVAIQLEDLHRQKGKKLPHRRHGVWPLDVDVARKRRGHLVEGHDDLDVILWEYDYPIRIRHKVARRTALHPTPVTHSHPCPHAPRQHLTSWKTPHLQTHDPALTPHSHYPPHTYAPWGCS